MCYHQPALGEQIALRRRQSRSIVSVLFSFLAYGFPFGFSFFSSGFGLQQSGWRYFLGARLVESHPFRLFNLRHLRVMNDDLYHAVAL